MKTSRLAALLVTVLMGASAQAGFLIEPYLGYNMDTINATTGASALPTPNVSSKLTGTGMPIGLRIGGVWGKFWTALDAYSLMSGKSKDDATVSTDYTVKETWAAIDLGGMWGAWRAWVSISLMDELGITADVSGATETKFKGGMGYGVGFGYSWGKVALNFVYLMHKYKTLESGPASVDVISDTIYSTFDHTSMGLQVSFPFGAKK